MLTKDLAKYQEVVNSWKIPAVRESFEIVPEIGTLFVVRPTAVRDRMRDGVLAKVKPHLLKPYLSRREDYASAGIEKMVCFTPLISKVGHVANS